MLTVPPRAHSAATLPFKRVLCAIDFSDASLEALNYAGALAQQSHSRLQLLHVVQWPWDEPPAPAPQELPPEQAVALGEYRRYVEASAMARLASLRRERIPEGIEAVPRIVPREGLRPDSPRRRGDLRRSRSSRRSRPECRRADGVRVDGEPGRAGRRVSGPDGASVVVRSSDAVLTWSAEMKRHGPSSSGCRRC